MEETGKLQANSVPCSVCENWFHQKCVKGMTVEFVESCDAMMRIEGKSPFICFCCRSKVDKYGALVKEQQQETKDARKEALEAKKLAEDVMKELQIERLERQVLAEKIQRMEGNTVQVTTKNVEIEKEMESGMEKAKEEVKKEMATELKQQEEKAENVVVYGIKESEKEEKEEKEAEDTAKVNEMVDAIGIEVSGVIEVKYRAGKKIDGGKPRPIVVKVTDDETRSRLVANARRLGRIPEWKNVYVGNDMTFKQREEARKLDAKLWAEANRKTEEAKNEGRDSERYVVIGQRGRDRRVVMWKSWGERRGQD